MTAVTLTFFALFPLATVMVGIGLSKRFDAMDVYKLTSYVLAIGGVIGLVIYLTAMNAPDLGIQTLLWINSVVLYIQSIGLFIIGYGMYKCARGGRSSLRRAPRRKAGLVEATPRGAGATVVSCGPWPIDRKVKSRVEDAILGRELTR